MGIIRKPTMKAYWSTYPNVVTPFFNSIISRDKFYRIMRGLHFVDNAISSTDRTYKISPVIKKLNQRFFDVYKPKQHISIDETLLLWKGKLLFSSIYQ